MFLESLYQDAARRRSSFVDRLKAGGDVNPATALAPSHSGANLNQALGYNPTLVSHGRQYEHGNTGWPFACIRIIAQRIAGQEIKVGRWVGKPQQGRSRRGVKRPHLERLPRTLKDLREDLEVIDNHPLLEAINDPNALMVRWALLFVTVASLEITGKAYWWFFNEKRDRTGKWSILPVPASWITPRHAEGKLYAEWEIRSDQNAKPVVVPGDEVAYIYYPDPANPLSALSPLQAQAKAVVADEAMTEAQRRAFSQGLWPGVAITMGRNPGVGGQQGNRPILTEHQRAQIINAVKQAYQGVVRNEEPIILDGWIEAVNRISNSPREMDFTRSGEVTKARITQGYGVNPIVMGQIEGANRACHDEATELLTRRGWLRHDEVQMGDLAATMNPTTGRFEWQEVSRVHVYPNYDGEMIRLSGTKIDALVTPEHRMWSRRGYRNGKAIPDSRYGFKSAGDLRCHDVLPLSPLPQTTERLEAFYLPGVRFGSGLECERRIPGRVLLMDPFLEFLGWFVSEGWTVSHCSKRTGRRYYNVGIKQAVGGIEECRRIESCMRALRLGTLQVVRSMARTAAESEDGYARQAANTYLLSDKRLWMWLRANCGVGSSNKRLPDFLFRLPAEQAVRTLASMLLGDGSHRVATEQKRYSHLHASYASKSDELMDQTQALAVLCGRAARLRRDTVNGTHTMGVSEYSREMSLLPKHLSRERYRGVVWCVTVPNGLVLTRRNGKTLVSGNSSATADDHFCNTTCNPKIELISQCLTAWAGPIFATPGERLYVWIEPAQANDPELQMDRLKVMMGYGAVTVNEVRAEMGWSPVPGGDVAYVPNTVTAVDLSQKRDLQAEQTPAIPPAQDGGAGGTGGVPVPDPQAA
jgi:hypothetical protein